MSNIKVLVSPNHPLFESIKERFNKTIVVDPVNMYELDGSDFDEIEYIYDFTCFDFDSKISLLEKLDMLSDSDVISDLTVNWGEYLLEHFTNLKGAFAGSFWSPTDTIEFYAKEEYILNHAIDLFKLLNLNLKNISNTGISFTYPRVISMIINEAYFSKEEKLATDNDIDTAMKYGVNYPLGPFEWAQKIGHDKVVMSLDELYRVTGDPRYRVSRKLRIQA